MDTLVCNITGSATMYEKGISHPNYGAFWCLSRKKIILSFTSSQVLNPKLSKCTSFLFILTFSDLNSGFFWEVYLCFVTLHVKICPKLKILLVSGSSGSSTVPNAKCLLSTKAQSHIIPVVSGRIWVDMSKMTGKIVCSTILCLPHTGEGVILVNWRGS